MPDTQFISDVQRFTAVSAVGVSALRRQGAGSIGRIQGILGSLNLTETNQIRSAGEYAAWLDQRTDALAANANVRWGAARKALNLFLRDCLYNKYLSRAYNLDHLEPWMEIPLDSVVAQQLKLDAGRGHLPIWNGLKLLTRKDSNLFQQHASNIAASRQIARVHLDVSMWINNR